MRISLLAAVALSCVSAAAGWFASELTHAGTVAAGQSIHAAWQSQLTALTDQDGRLRNAEGALAAGAESLGALSLGLAMHYDQLTADEKGEIQRLLPRARAVPFPRDGHNGQAVIDCIREAGTGGVSEECLSRALAHS